MPLHTYYFRADEQDPVLDIVRTCIEIYAAKRSISFSKAVKEVSKDSNVSTSCIHAWMDGRTRKPYFCNVMAVVHATGRDVTISGEGKSQKVVGNKPRFRVISNKAVA